MQDQKSELTEGEINEVAQEIRVLLEERILELFGIKPGPTDGNGDLTEYSEGFRNVARDILTMTRLDIENYIP